MFHLALKLGMTVSELSSRMSAREMMEWNIYLSLQQGDLNPRDVEQDLMNFFGVRRG
jgi:hypothetical protein